MADEVFEVTRPSALLPVALGRERIYQAIGFPMEMFPALFAIPRASGWLSQWQEMLGDPEQKIARPRPAYLGAGERGYVEIGTRDEMPEGRA